MTSNSQYQEDLFIEKFFSPTEGHTFKGTLLDVGANDGKTLSNSFNFIQQGWKADLVEPSPRAFELLEQRYIGNPDVSLHNYAIGKEEVTTLYESGSLLTEQDIALVSTLISEERDRWHKQAVFFREVKVQSITFEHLQRISTHKKWDFITIDAEGIDLEILKQINLAEVGCRCLCIEHNGKNIEAFKFIAEKYGLYLLGSSPTNLIFAR